MPLVHISHTSQRSQTEVDLMSEGVRAALFEHFGVPRDDYFQLVTVHEPESEIRGPASFLGIGHTANLVFVQITCAEGRTVEQKKALYDSIASSLSSGCGVRKEDVIINLIETKRENWSFGNGLAQFS